MPLPEIVPLHLLDALVPAESPSAKPAPVSTLPSYAEIEEALRCLPAHFGANSYNTWLEALMAVHSVFPGADGVALCERYIPGKPGEIERKFAGFDGSGGVGVGTLFHLAENYGYRSTRRNASYSAQLPELSNDEIDALIRGVLPTVLPFDLYNYRPEDGGILDAWLDHHSNGWLFITGYDYWSFWTGTHWQEDRTHTLSREVTQLASAMNFAAGAKLKEAFAEPEDTRKNAVLKANTYINATKRTAGRIGSVTTMAMGFCSSAAADMDMGEALNLENGTLDLNKLKLREHRREDHLTYCLPFDHDPDAIAPHWCNEYLPRVFVYEDSMLTDPTLISLCQELIGYSLTPDTSLEIMIWLYGEGGNGKTLMIEILKALLGPMATSVDFQTIGLPGNYDLAKLPGKRIAFSTESERGGTIAEGYIKKIVSGETISARPIYGAPFDFHATPKVWWAMNDKPVIKSTSNSVWRRLKMLPFYREFTETEKDVSLRGKLMEELPGILNWALEGLQRLRNNHGHFTHSPAAEAFLQEYIKESNPVSQWLSERTVPATEPTTSAKSLYNDYAEWCKSAGRQKMSETNFGREMKRLKIIKGRTADCVRYACFLRAGGEFATDLGL